MERMKSRDQIIDWVADHYHVEQKCNGNRNEALMAGAINAMDYDEETHYSMTEEEFCVLAYSEYDNMGY